MVLKAFHINEHEVYAGETLEEAIAHSMLMSGLSRDQVFDGTADGGEMPPAVIVDKAEGGKTTVGEMLSSMNGPELVCYFDV